MRCAAPRSTAARSVSPRAAVTTASISRAPPTACGSPVTYGSRRQRRTLSAAASCSPRAQRAVASAPRTYDRTHCSPYASHTARASTHSGTACSGRPWKVRVAAISTRLRRWKASSGARRPRRGLSGPSQDVGQWSDVRQLVRSQRRGVRGAGPEHGVRAAADQRDQGGGPVGPGQLGRRAPAPAQEEPLPPVPQLRPGAARDPVEPQAADQAQPARGLAGGGQTEVERRAQIVVLGAQPGQRARLIRPEPTRSCSSATRTKCAHNRRRASPAAPSDSSFSSPYSRSRASIRYRVPLAPPTPPTSLTSTDFSTSPTTASSTAARATPEPPLAPARAPVPVRVSGSASLPGRVGAPLARVVAAGRDSRSPARVPLRVGGSGVASARPARSRSRPLRLWLRGRPGRRQAVAPPGSARRTSTACPAGSARPACPFPRRRASPPAGRARRRRGPPPPCPAAQRARRRTPPPLPPGRSCR